MLILELESFPLEQVTDVNEIEMRLGQWVMAHPFPVRLLAYSHRFDIRPALRKIQLMQRELTPAVQMARALLPSLRALTTGDVTAPHPADAVEDLDAPSYALLRAICSDGLSRIIDDPESATATEWLLLGEVMETLIWPRPYLDDMAAFYEALGAQHLRAATYIVITWEPVNAQAQEIIDSLTYATGRAVRRRERLPAALRGSVRVDERNARLVPERPGDPYVSLLRSYQMPVPFDASVLHPLMDLDCDLAIAVDVQTLTHGQAQTLAEMQMSAAQVALRTNNAVDPNTEQRAYDAERVLYDLRTQSLHQVQIAVMVTGEDAKALAKNTAAARDRLGVTVRMEPVAGSQAELIRLFSSMPSTQIDAAWRREDMLSKGVGCLFGVVGYHRSPSTSGWMWGIDAARRSPVFFDPFAGEHAGHMVFLGETGYGKTFAMNVMTIRAAVQAGHRVIWVDAYENAPRVERAIGGGAVRHVLSLGRTINLLDIVYGPEDGSEWRLMQVQHVVAQLALLMGKTALTADGKRTLNARMFNEREEGYIQRAVQMVYEGVEAHTDLAEMPILTDLIAALEEIDASEPVLKGIPRYAREIAHDLRVMLFGSVTDTSSLTAKGKSFNGVTTVDWNITDDVVCFDLTEVQRGAEELLPFYYAQAIGAIYRYMRDPSRDRSRKTLLIIDEFGLAARIKSVAQLAVTISKVARKYGVALVTADQLPITYLGSEEGRQILENSRIQVMFHLKPEPAKEIAAALSQLAPGHTQFIIQARKGECVMVYDRTALPLVVEPSPRELSMLTGS